MPTRTLSSSYIASRLRFLIAPNFGNTAPEVFWAVDNSSPPENTNGGTSNSGVPAYTANVNSHMAYSGAGAAMGTLTWNGHANTPYFVLDGTSAYISFDSGGSNTNRPALTQFNDNQYTLFYVGKMPTITSSRFLVYTHTGSSAPVYSFSGSSPSTAKFLTGGGVTLGQTTTNITSGDIGTLAYLVDSVTDNQNDTFWALAGSSMARDRAAVNPSGSKFGTFLTFMGSDASEQGWTNAQILMFGAFKDEFGYGSSQNTSRVAELQSLHADPFGYMFTTAVAGGGALNSYSVRRRQ